jgi:hypothetical protein
MSRGYPVVVESTMLDKGIRWGAERGIPIYYSPTESRWNPNTQNPDLYDWQLFFQNPEDELRYGEELEKFLSDLADEYFAYFEFNYRI